MPAFALLFCGYLQRQAATAQTILPHPPSPSSAHNKRSRPLPPRSDTPVNPRPKADRVPLKKFRPNRADRSPELRKKIENHSAARNTSPACVAALQKLEEHSSGIFTNRL